MDIESILFFVLFRGKQDIPYLPNALTVRALWLQETAYGIRGLPLNRGKTRGLDARVDFNSVIKAHALVHKKTRNPKLDCGCIIVGD